MPLIICPPFLCLLRLSQWRLLWILVVVNHVGLHLEEQHHGVIFVNRVVTVHRPVTLKVAEAEKDRRVLIELKPSHILARYLHTRHAGTRRAEAAPAPAKANASSRIGTVTDE